MAQTYHVRFGVLDHVGRFRSAVAVDRGLTVVIESGRGTELGTVIAEAGPEEAGADGSSPSIVREAGPDDLGLARRVAADRHRLFDACRSVFDRGTWPIVPIDVEPLLDDGRAVLHYLGPHRLDVAGLRAAIWDHCGVDLVFEPAGLDSPATESEPEPDHGCGSCGTGGKCGGGSCGDSAGGSCSGCSVQTLVASRRGSTRAV